VNLDAEQLLAIIARGEGRQIEFKRGLPGPEKTARSICAFANTSGGMLIVGVTDQGRVYGLEKPRTVVHELRRICAEVLSPALQAEVLSVTMDEHKVVVCSVPLSGARPHAVLHPGGEPEITVRVGSSNRRPSGATLKVLTSSQHSRKSPDALQHRILQWVERHAQRSKRPEGESTVKGFARANNVGVQRARRAFTELERQGRLVGHGLGTQRVFRVA
jgi:predicted HTH transcriptional regulator